MNDILVCVETRSNAVQTISLELLTAARRLAESTGGKVEALVLGSAPRLAVPSLGAADRVLVAADARLERYLPEAHLVVIEAVVKDRNPAAVLFAYNTTGLDLAPALALKANRPLIAYVKTLSAEGGTLRAESQIYGGKLVGLSEVQLPAVLAVMPGAFAEAATGDGATAEIIDIAIPSGMTGLRTSFVSESVPDSSGVDIATAEKIVCVGRGIKDKEGVEQARQLADSLGAEIAGSRPVVDDGLLPRERQVGKSGRKVKPKLYLALGVSGAPEHLEGMKASELIIAVNTDAKAPIFDVAHYGATCDLRDLLDALEEERA